MASRSSTTDAAQRPPLCAAAPILWSLLPLGGGILAVRAAAPAWAAAAAVAALLAAAGAGGALRAARRGGSAPARRRATRALVAALSLLAGLLLAARQAPAPPAEWDFLPAREALLTVRITGLFNARKPDRVAGIATILRSDIPHDTVSGHPAAFHLETGASGQPPGIGSTLECRAVLTYLPALAQPDDYQQYLLRREVRLTIGQGALLREAAPPPRLERLRQRLYARSQALLSTGCTEPGDPGHVLASMLLGNRSLLSDERTVLYRRTGTFHLFAVSGLHVGSVALCLLFLARLLRLPPAARLVPVLAGTWAYVWLTGSSPSAVRAGIMISCLTLARPLLRQPHPFPALALSAWIVLALDPSQLFHLGFQLSYAVVAAILLSGLPLARAARLAAAARWPGQQALQGWRRRAAAVPLATADLACVSLAASLASMPLIVQHFGLVTPGGMLFGILLNPLTMLAVMAGTVTLLAGPLLGAALAGWIARATWPAIDLMEWLLRLCLAIPGAAADRRWAWPPAGTALLAAILLAAWLLQRLRQGGVRLPAASLLLPHALALAALALLSVGS